MAKLRGIDAEIFPLVLGGNTFGWTSDESTSDQVLDAYTAAGGNLIDTADVYSAWAPGHSGGESEIVLGRWLAKNGNRNKVLVATKEIGRASCRERVERSVGDGSIKKKKRDE